MDKRHANEKSKSEISVNIYPPVVSVLGHVDHGKTTLLDRIRKTSIALSETGGITQGVGASQVEVIHEGRKRIITFIDTPGHEVFANMRKQGVSASDIVLLVVAADDGVMPQTKESIGKILEAKLPFIVVCTKIDLEGAHIEKVKQQLLKEHVMLEGYGGDVPFILVSSKTGQGVQELLDIILLVYDLSHIKKDEKEEFFGVIIESKVDKKRGVLVSIIVKNGTLAVSDTVFVGNREVGKVRALSSASSKTLVCALPGSAVEIFGLKTSLPTGTVVYTSAKESSVRIQEDVAMSPSERMPHDISAFLSNEKKNDTLKIILKTEGIGELEAITQSLPENVKVMYQGQGHISVSDVMMAKDFGAIIVGFRVGIAHEAKGLAESEHILYRIYHIIYELLDELQDVVVHQKMEAQEVVLGRGQITARFEAKDTQILGVKIVEGRLALSDKVRILRGEKEIGKAKITSLRRGKVDVKEMGKGSECGVVISPQIDFSINDMLLSYK